MSAGSVASSGSSAIKVRTLPPPVFITMMRQPYPLASSAEMKRRPGVAVNTDAAVKSAVASPAVGSVKMS